MPQPPQVILDILLSLSVPFGVTNCSMCGALRITCFIIITITTIIITHTGSGHAFILVGRLLPVTASVRVALPCMVLAMACMRAWRQAGKGC